MATKEFDLSGFSRITVKTPMDVKINRADNYSVSISGSDMVIDHTEVSLEGNTLELGYKADIAGLLARPFSRLEARITTPDLLELNIKGAAHIKVRDFNFDHDFTILLTGASRMELSDIAVGNMKWDIAGASRITGDIKAAGTADLRISGASRIDLKGSARDMEIEASGASRLELDDFQVQNASVRFNGATNSAINVVGKLNVNLEEPQNWNTKASQPWAKYGLLGPHP